MKTLNIMDSLAVRYLLVVGMAFVVAVSLFYLMSSLIRMSEVAVLEDAEPNRVIDFVRTKHATETPIEEKELPQKSLLDAPTPPKLTMNEFAEGGEGPALKFNSIAIAPPAPDLKIAGLRSASSSSSALIPLVRIQPLYPQAAATQRIEGWVELVFDIDAEGKVIHPRVKRMFPNDIFNRAALQAIKKWRYRPKVLNGHTVETPNVSVRLRFSLDDIESS